ncbi:hypothetical protein BN1723_002110, partial [Verticillium longisporum]
MAMSLAFAAKSRAQKLYHSPDAWRVTRDDTICCWACQRGPVAAARCLRSLGPEERVRLQAR